MSRKSAMSSRPPVVIIIFVSHIISEGSVLNDRQGTGNPPTSELCAQTGPWLFDDTF